MNESTQGNNAGDLIDPKREVSIDDLVAEYLALARDFAEKIKLKQELFGLKISCQRLLTASSKMLDSILLEKKDLEAHWLKMRCQGTPVPTPEKCARQDYLNSQRSFFEDKSAELATDMDGLKAVKGTYDQQIADIKNRLGEIRKIIEQAHPEVTAFNVQDTGDI
ncbi:unnamed protein product [Clonostachys rosea f. rosea IK726]|uniref:Uncharacterized protein n=1 Tax=Clonostachys rosea f. rosea IK726 TaxID=1349383 RepID=A0ACA9UST2_BIOOC|nr:unnamed protein product [Clonostachys rosea f. rosea IK726]